MLSAFIWHDNIENAYKPEHYRFTFHFQFNERGIFFSLKLAYFPTTKQFRIEKSQKFIKENAQEARHARYALSTALLPPFEAQGNYIFIVKKPLEILELFPEIFAHLPLNDKRKN